jgi:hypothetical protein
VNVLLRPPPSNQGSVEPGNPQLYVASRLSPHSRSFLSRVRRTCNPEFTMSGYHKCASTLEQSPHLGGDVGGGFFTAGRRVSFLNATAGGLPPWLLAIQEARRQGRGFPFAGIVSYAEVRDRGSAALTRQVPAATLPPCAADF